MHTDPEGDIALHACIRRRQRPSPSTQIQADILTWRAVSSAVPERWLGLEVSWVFCVSESVDDPSVCVTWVCLCPCAVHVCVFSYVFCHSLCHITVSVSVSVSPNTDRRADGWMDGASLLHQYCWINDRVDRKIDQFHFRRSTFQLKNKKPQICSLADNYLSVYGYKWKETDRQRDIEINIHRWLRTWCRPPVHTSYTQPAASPWTLRSTKESGLNYWPFLGWRLECGQAPGSRWRRMWPYTLPTPYAHCCVAVRHGQK